MEELRMPPKDVADAIFSYLYNRSPLEIVLDVFRGQDRTITDLVPEYVFEKANRLGTSPSKFYGYLDDGNQRRFVELAIAHSLGARPATSDEKVVEYLTARAEAEKRSAVEEAS